MSWNWIDIAVALCVAIPAWSGFRAGLVAGLLRLAGLVGGGVAVVIWMAPVTAFIQSHLSLPDVWIPVVAVVGGMVGGWLIGWFLSIWWKKASAGNPVGWVDRAAGAALGGSKGIMFAVVLLAIVTLVSPAAGIGNTLKRSASGKFLIAPATEWTRSWMETRVMALRGTIK